MSFLAGGIFARNSAETVGPRVKNRHHSKMVPFFSMFSHIWASKRAFHTKTTTALIIKTCGKIGFKKTCRRNSQAYNSSSLGAKMHFKPSLHSLAQVARCSFLLSHRHTLSTHKLLEQHSCNAATVALQYRYYLCREEGFSSRCR